jgi:hypothetical protein
MFRTPLSVRHVVGEDWELTQPLIFEGNEDYYVIRRGFRTDFASIPRPVRWLIDTAGRNAEPGVLHDAVWRESKRKENPRVDPWDADGLFRRALRESGSPALTRGLMWIAVRAAALFGGRFGNNGPSLGFKILQVVGMGVVGLVALGLPTLVVLVGIAFYWLLTWIVAVPWIAFERHHHVETNLPWPFTKKDPEQTAPTGEKLVIIPKSSTEGVVPEIDLRSLLTEPVTLVTEEALEEVLSRSEMASAR